MKQLYKELRAIRDSGKQPLQGPEIFTPPAWVLLKVRAGKPSLFLLWFLITFSPAPGLTLENLDHWLIFHASFLLQVLISSYYIWSVRNFAETWHMSSTIRLMFTNAAIMITVTLNPELFALLRSHTVECDWCFAPFTLRLPLFPAWFIQELPGSSL